MSDQQHAPAALYPSGKSRYPLYRRLGGPQGRSFFYLVSDEDIVSYKSYHSITSVHTVLLCSYSKSCALISLYSIVVINYTHCSRHHSQHSSYDSASALIPSTTSTAIGTISHARVQDREVVPDSFSPFLCTHQFPFRSLREAHVV